MIIRAGPRARALQANTTEHRSNHRQNEKHEQDRRNT